jgi:hypothetical protein
MKTCLAFDQSSTKTGIALGVETQPTVFTVQWAVTIETPTSDALVDNFPWMKMTGFNPDIIAHEEGFVPKAQVSRKTGEFNKPAKHVGIVIATTGGWVQMLRTVYFRYARLHHAMATTWRPPVWGKDYQDIIREPDKKEREKALKAYSCRFADAHVNADPHDPVIKAVDDHMGDAIGIMAWAFGEDRKTNNGGKI